MSAPRRIAAALALAALVLLIAAPSQATFAKHPESRLRIDFHDDDLREKLGGLLEKWKGKSWLDRDDDDDDRDHPWSRRDRHDDDAWDDRDHGKKKRLLAHLLDRLKDRDRHGHYYDDDDRHRHRRGKGHWSRGKGRWGKGKGHGWGKGHWHKKRRKHDPPPVIPEPSTAIMMGLGLAGLGYSGRRRRS